jgi:hypothetical protein
MSIPVITSQDILSYIAYARMAVIYHLNPLTNSPVVIHDDYVYGFLYWINQPSIYGPTWILIISLLQRVTLLFGFNYVLSMELMLRLFSLCMHLGSTLLIWCISARLADAACSSKGCYYPLTHRFQVQRVRATLAFAWNPFLLFESSVNAHIDVTILCLLLLGIWFLFAVEERCKFCYPLAAVVFGVIACIKITCLILLPGLLLFLWTHYASSVSYGKRIGMLLLMGAISLGVIVVLYLPFWENGAVLNILKVTPTVTREMNSIYDFLVGIYDWVCGIKMHDTSLDHSSLFEIYTHSISTIIFCVGYCVIIVRSLLLPHVIKSQPAFLSWLALIWLLFCVLGSPWFWPWYCVILFGLFALLEVYYGYNAQVPFVFGRLNTTLFGLALSISLFSLYCFGNLAQTSNQLQLSWLGGGWIWGLPCLVLICISRYFPHWFKIRPERP